jgi:hypothetical protein
MTEIVGGFHFSLSAFRATYSTFADPATYPSAALMEARTYAEVTLEEACGRAFVPRYALERVPAGGRWLRITMPDVRVVRTVVGSDYTLSPSDTSATSTG